MAFGRLFVKGVRYGVKYGPAAKVVFDQVKEPASDYAKGKLDSQRSRRIAIDKARTLEDGSLLRVIHGEKPVWIVFSGDEAISAHPDPGVPVSDLLVRADLSLRRRPDELPTPKDRAVAARKRAVASVRRKRS